MNWKLWLRQHLCRHCWHVMRPEARVDDGRETIKLRGGKHVFKRFVWNGEIKKCHKCKSVKWEGIVHCMEGIASTHYFKDGYWRDEEKNDRPSRWWAR